MADSVMPDFQPIKMLEVELSSPLLSLEAHQQDGKTPYSRARVLVRLHRHPLGMIDVSLEDGRLSPNEYVDQVWRELSGNINSHLRTDGISAVTELTLAGIVAERTPSCVEQDQTFLMTAPFISVVVPTRDRTDRLEGCLNTLLAQDYPSYELIVVDNAPRTSATEELASRLRADQPRIRYVCEPQPGVAAARNRGLLEARANIIAFADDDVLVDSYWLIGIAKAFAAADKVGCVTGPILPAEIETAPQWWLELFGGNTHGFTQQVFDLAEHRVASSFYPYESGAFGAGANMAFDKQVLREIGGFYLSLRYGEDMMAFFNTLAAGYRLVYEPSAFVYHFHFREYARLRKQMSAWGAGFTAFLTACILDRPTRFFDLLLRCLKVVRQGRVVRQETKPGGYPAELPRLHRRGMLYGPVAYAKGRWRARLIPARLKLK